MSDKLHVAWVRPGGQFRCIHPDARLPLARLRALRIEDVTSVEYEYVEDSHTVLITLWPGLLPELIGSVVTQLSIVFKTTIVVYHNPAEVNFGGPLTVSRDEWLGY